MPCHSATEELAMAGYLINPLEVCWTYMTDNYSEFTIATWFSVVLHEVRTLLCFTAVTVRVLF